MNKLPALLSFAASWKTAFLGFAAVIAFFAHWAQTGQIPDYDAWVALLAAVGVINAKDFNVGSK